jgi:hypothetical protein
MDGNDVVQQIAPTTLDPSFRHAVGISVQLRRMAMLRFDVSE